MKIKGSLIIRSDGTMPEPPEATVSIEAELLGWEGADGDDP